MRVLPKYRNTFFIRLILSYTILVIVITGIAGGYLYTQAQRLMVDEISRDSRNRLVTAKDYIEQTLLRRFEDNLQNKALSTIFFQNNSNLNFLLDEGWQGNFDRITSFRQDLEQLNLTNEGAYNITVYFSKRNFVVDHNYFYIQPGNSKDAAFISNLDKTVPKRWLIRTLADGKQVMSYVVKLPYDSSSAETKGYLFVDVDMAYIKESAAKIMSSPLESLYIFDAKGNLIVNTEQANPDDIRILQTTIGSGQTVKEINDDKRGKVVVSYLDGSKSGNGWTYAIIRPMNSFVLSSGQFKTKIIIGCSLVLLLGLLISYLISKRFYIPMKKLVLHIRSLYQPNQTNLTNEYTIIGNALNFMGQKIVTLESLAKTNEMKNLVLGAGLDLEHMDGLPKDCRYLVAHIRLIEGVSERFKHRYEQFNHPVRYELICLNSKEAAIIYFFDSRGKPEDETAADNLFRVQAEMRGEIEFGAAIGALVQSPEEIPISYQLAQQAYRYRFLYGSDAIVLHSKISLFKPSPYLFSYDQYKNALKAGNINGANRFIDDFAATLEERNQQLEAVELALLQLVSTIYQVVIELELQKLVPPSNLFDELKKDTLNETIESIRSLSGRIAVYVQESGNHAHADVILKLKAYIDEHLHEDLSLNILSEEASLAPAYISTLFGEVMKESFTEYVTRARLDKAAGLLIDDPRMAVAEIASLVGYRNPQYFHNKFKARFGITPVQYRNTKNTAVPVSE
ncbi:helix-turn-helix domain-containing protein [Paenibacillus sp. sptzw28]|uniref:helix-turn-helix domain-containing protein n=1 Tax=Paenibacillus sp. sptzw28 TaxID=715179 RepID=UPI001C6F5D71|nr:helix-turn-helix domain-containing protein [Paenibacillus sp. sptzw28]QYR19565.1 helix-turn-helix domain-containing protein [Paenibacillus sp. sptzw28]